MKAGHAAKAVAALAAVIGLTLGVSGCQLLPVTHKARIRLSAPAAPPSVLAVVLGALSTRTRVDFQDLVVGTARPGEHVMVFSAFGGVSLGTFAAPPPPTTSGPVFPSPIARSATSFQQVSYERKLRLAQAELHHDLIAVRRRQLRELQAPAVLNECSTARLSSVIALSFHNFRSQAVDGVSPLAIFMVNLATPSTTRGAP